MKTFVLLIALLSVSFVPEVMDADFTLELRSLVFAVAICALVFVIGIMEWKKTTPSCGHPSLLRRGINMNKFALIDMVYATCVGMTVVFLFLNSAETRVFHYAFVSVGMFLVYIFFRGIFCHRGTEGTEGENHNPLVPPSFAGLRFFKGELLIFLIVAVGFVNALIGVIHFFCGKDVIGTFGAESFFGCFLAVNVPLAFCLVLELWVKKSSSYRLSVISYRFLNFFCISAFVVMIGVIVLTKSRTAMIGLGVVLPLMLYFYHRGTETRRKKSKLSLRLGVLARVIIFVVFALFCGRILYKLKPTSAVGRTLIWRVSAEMFLKNPVSGVGYGNFPNVYNLYQGEFFANGGGTEAQKMAASTIRHAYNWYLETAAEFGFFGLVVFGIFWWLILVEVYKVFFRAKPRSREKLTDYRLNNHPTLSGTPPKTGGEFTDYFLNMGMAGSVLCFMIMCLFHFPYKIIPTYLIFNIALAWIVNTNGHEENQPLMNTNGHE